MKRVNSAAAQKRALLNTHELVTVAPSLVHKPPTVVDNRGELQKIRDAREEEERASLHKKLTEDPRMQARAKETGLTPDQLLQLAGQFKGDQYGFAVEYVRNELQTGTSFDQAIKLFRNLLGGRTEKER